MYCFLGVFILLDVLRTSEISGLVSDINLEKFSVTVSNIYCSFLSSFWFPIKHIATFIVVPQSLHILFCFSSPCSLRFSVLEVSIEILLSSAVLSSACFFLVIKCSLHFCYNVFDLYHFFFILRISISLLILCVLACCLLYPLTSVAY